MVDEINRRACATAFCAGGASEGIDWVFKPGRTYIRATDGVTIFTADGSGIFDFQTNLPAGFTGANTPYLTGLLVDWTSSSDNCNSWLSGTALFEGAFGNGLSIDIGAVSFATTGCNTNLRKLLCVEQ